MNWVITDKSYSQRRACRLVGLNRKSFRYVSRRSDDDGIRKRLRELAMERRRFGYRRLHILLRREGIELNHKKLYRLYKEERLTVKKRGGRKRALGTRSPMTIPQGPNQRRSLDFVSDSLIDSRRFRILCVIDDFSGECLATVVDNSISGIRVARELDRIIGIRGIPRMVVSETRAPATIRRYLSSIAHLHRAAGVETPTTAEIVKLAIKRVTKGRARQHQASPLNRQLIDHIIDGMGDRLIDLRDKALISVAYDTLARRSGLVAIDVDDISITDDGTGTVLIRRTKTDQVGEGSVRFIAHDTCQHLIAWIEAAKIGDGAVFRALSKGGVINGRLDGSEVSRIFKRRTRAAGVDPSSISEHPSRVGAAQDLVAADLGVAEVMQAGGWKSPQMVARYTEHLQARRGAMSKLAAKQGRL